MEKLTDKVYISLEYFCLTRPSSQSNNFTVAFTEGEWVIYEKKISIKQNCYNSFKQNKKNNMP